VAALPDRSNAAVGRLTGMAYTLTQDELRARVREVTAQSYAFGASWLRGAIDERELPMAPEHLVCVIHALTEGLVFQRLLTPELVPDEVFYEAFAALAAKKAAPCAARNMMQPSASKTATRLPRGTQAAAPRRSTVNTLLWRWAAQRLGRRRR
jgi:hypothetical protein